jgi:hypothetical protein
MFISVRFLLVGEDECGKYDLINTAVKVTYQQKDGEGSLGGKGGGGGGDGKKKCKRV